MRILVASCLLAILAVTGCSADDAEPDESTPEPSAESPAGSPGSADGPAYVALGDSYTSAPGVSETVDAGCFRSSLNYPALVAQELGLALTDVSCGGATTASLVGEQETSAGAVPPQYQAITPETDIVTMSLGGNDEGLFTQLLSTCLSLSGQAPDGAPCRDALNAGGSDQALATIALVQDRLVSALSGVRDRAPDAQIVLVGYPQLAPASGQCDDLPLTPGDYEYVHGLLVALGDATEAAASAAEVGYADVLAASDGHDVCAGEDAWVKGIVNDDGRAAIPMHPYAEEQEAVAELVVAALAD